MLMNKSIKNALKLLLLVAVFFAGFIAKQESEITTQDVFSAAKLIGLDFTDAEADSLLDDVKDTKSSLGQLHEATPPNDLYPALFFSPAQVFPPTYMGEDLLEVKQEKITVPKNREELAFYSITELAWLLEHEKITPLELTEIYLSRLKKYGDTLECVVTIIEEEALDKAKIATQEIKNGNYKGLLHGIPFGVKDLLAVKGYKTTWGAMPYKEQMIDETATLVKKLEDKGAILIAKLTLGALAYGDVWFDGVTRNPWNLKQGSSGSSAGSASATVAGLVGFSIGTETLGSIVSPSTRCGATGLRPTFGGVSRHGAMALSWTMDKIGPICRSAEDCAIVFQAIHGKDVADPFSVDYDFHFKSEKPADLKIAYVRNLFDSSWNKENDAKVLTVLKEGGLNLETIDWLETDIPVGSMSIILTAEAAAAFDELTLSNADDQMVRQGKSAWPNIFRASRFIPAVEYIQANRLRVKLMQQFSEWAKEYDAILVPSFGDNQLLVTNLTGHPAVVMPNGYQNGNSPRSFSIIGNYYEEGKLLQVANYFQELTDFENQRPPYFAVQ